MPPQILNTPGVVLTLVAPFKVLLHCERRGEPLVDFAPLAPLAPLAFRLN